MNTKELRNEQNKEYRELCSQYRASLRFIEFTKESKCTLHENGVLAEEVELRNRAIFNFECALSTLDQPYHKIIEKDVADDDSLWYVGIISRSTYYRCRQKAIEMFLKMYHRLEVL